jgi:hypothetical protein
MKECQAAGITIQTLKIIHRIKTVELKEIRILDWGPLLLSEGRGFWVVRPSRNFQWNEWSSFPLSCNISSHFPVPLANINSPPNGILGCETSSETSLALQIFVALKTKVKIKVLKLYVSLLNFFYSQLPYLNNIDLKF